MGKKLAEEGFGGEKNACYNCKTTPREGFLLRCGMAFEDKPKILLSALWDRKLESYWMLPAYTDLLLKLGAAPFILPLGYKDEELEALAKGFDGLLLCGGDDLNPALYGEAEHEKLGPYEDRRDRQERLLFEAACRLGMPVFGVCRGLQLINVCLGGTLYQDLPSQKPSEVEHHMDEPYDRAEHEVKLTERGLFAELLGRTSLGVNSCHHQAIRTLGRDLEVLAEAPDGIAEAIRGTSHPYLVAVQWHPEFSYKKDCHSERILQSFVKAASDYQKR